MKRTPLQVRIPKEMREQLAGDPFMRHCILAGSFGLLCEGEVQWNHAFTYAGKRQNELWALIPMCKLHHEQEARYRFHIAQVMRERIVHFNATEDFKEKYPRSTLL